MRFLCGDTHRTIVGVTGSHRDAADRLHCRVRNGYGIGTQRQGFDEVRGLTKAARDYQGNVLSVATVQMPPRPIICPN